MVLKSKINSKSTNIQDVYICLKTRTNNNLYNKKSTVNNKWQIFSFVY